MFNYLRIFSWLLFTFGVVGWIAVALGFHPGISSTQAVMGVLIMQVIIASLIMYGFKLNRIGSISRTALLYGGWALIIALLLIGQLWLNASVVNV